VAVMVAAGDSAMTTDVKMMTMLMLIVMPSSSSALIMTLIVTLTFCHERPNSLPHYLGISLVDSPATISMIALCHHAVSCQFHRCVPIGDFRIDCHGHVTLIVRLVTLNGHSVTVRGSHDPVTLIVTGVTLTESPVTLSETSAMSFWTSMMTACWSY
jgi:hypothetical protein